MKPDNKVHRATFDRRDVLKSGLTSLGFGLCLPMCRPSATLAADRLDRVSDNFEMYATTWRKGNPRDRRDVPPPNRWMFINNTYGRGDLVNGRDFTCGMTARQDSFPEGALIEWDFRDGRGTGIGPFAYGYPALMYGGNSYGNAFEVAGPWPQKISDCKRLTLDYDVAITGNTNSFNLLIDLYSTEAPDTTDGSATGELSFFPFANPNLPFVPGGEVMAFSFGECWVGIQGKQMCFQPSSGGGTTHRTMLAAKIDILELFHVCIGKGWVASHHYLRGAEFGAEIQNPAPYNSAPYKGSLLFRKAPAWDWI
jgi:hypothetical protein